VTLDGAFAFPVIVFYAAGDGLLDEGLVVVWGDNLSDVQVGWVGVVLEAEQGVRCAIEIDYLA